MSPQPISATRTGVGADVGPTVPRCPASIASQLYNFLVIFDFMASTFDVLAEPTRRRILDLLREDERPVSELVRQLSLSQPGVSKHLKVLRDAGLVEVRHDAQRRYYRVRAAPLAEIDEWLQPYRRLWAGTLDALKHHLDETEDR
jgi:DNA-binding transcriptional ArsR family regulator